MSRYVTSKGVTDTGGTIKTFCGMTRRAQTRQGKAKVKSKFPKSPDESEVLTSETVQAEVPVPTIPLIQKCSGMESRQDAIT